MLSKVCNAVIEAMAQFLNECPDAFGPEDVEGLARDCNIGLDESLALLMSSAFGLEIDDNLEHREIYHRFIRPAIHKLSVDTYQSDPFWQTVDFGQDPKKEGNWELCMEQYKPFEVFVADDLQTLNSQGDFLPYLGFFTQPFSYPAVKQEGRIWMTVTPNEVETMREPIGLASGQVITFGLGLGYFALSTALKEEVSAVTVVERDECVIRLFKHYILPLFPKAIQDKICIEQDDAFRFAQFRLSASSFDFAFVDLWHDVSDGLPMYQRMKQIASAHPEIRWTYWIEKSLRCYL